MDSNEAQTLLKVLAELMDEQSEHTEQETQTLALYNEMRNEINTGLVSAVEQISYEKKYAVIDSANDLADTIGLYLNYPELIDKYVIGFYAPTTPQVKSVCTHYLRSSGSILAALKQKLGLSNQSGGLSDTIPTIFTHGEDHGQIRALNLAEKHVPLSPESYAVLEPGKHQEVELAGILISYYLSSPAVLEHQAVLVLPKGMDRRQNYHKVLVHAMDVMAVPCSAVDDHLAELLRSGNIKLLLAVGKCNDIQKSFLTALAGEIGSELIFTSGITDVYEILQAPERNIATNNFSNEVLMESHLCSVLWYLAEQKKLLSDRVAQINQDLLGGDSGVHTLTKELQKRTGDQVRALDKCADAYYASMQAILKRIEGLQQLYSGPAEGGLNDHVAMYGHLLDLLAAEGAFFQAYRKSNANDHIRNIEALCARTDGDQAVVRALVNSYYSRQQADGDLEAFAKYRTQSALLLKKKLEMRQQLKLSTEDCAGIIDGLDLPRSPMEYRLLGEAQYAQGERENAKENLKWALEAGDVEAGEFLYTMYKNDVGLVYLADHGVAKAAYQYGESFYKQEYIQRHRDEALRTAMKYLHIAAAREYIQAVELLGDIWFDRAMARQDSRKQFLGNALSYYEAVQKKKKLNKTVQERMGIIYFEQGDYQRARSRLEESGTLQALFLLGQMYEQGHGVAADEKKALEYYEKAAEKGHSQAQVEYSRLSSKIEQEAKKTTIDSGTSYYSSSYYSGYYSSYYSGW